MRRTLTSSLSLVLALARPAWAYYVEGRNAEPTPAVIDPWKDFAAWRAVIQRQLSRGQPIPLKSFDQMFNDDFFRRSPDPFKDIGSFPRRLLPILKERKRELFDGSWRDWTFERLDLSDVSPAVSRSADKVVVTLKLPRETAASLRVDVNAERIRIFYSKTTTRERKDAKGTVVSSEESVKRFEKVMPVPDDADGARPAIRRGLDSVQIVFPRLKR